jgi:hypothetical protein
VYSAHAVQPLSAAHHKVQSLANTPSSSLPMHMAERTNEQWLGTFRAGSFFPSVQNTGPHDCPPVPFTLSYFWQNSSGVIVTAFWFDISGWTTALSLCCPKCPGRLWGRTSALLGLRRGCESDDSLPTAFAVKKGGAVRSPPPCLVPVHLSRR